MAEEKIVDEELSEGSKKVLYDCFKQYDHSGNGILSRDELPDALRFAGIMASDKAIAELQMLFDKNGDGNLQISELVDSWKQLAQQSVNGDEILAAFKLLDTRCDGHIRLPDLKKLLMTAGEKWSEAEASATLQELMKYDKNGDGKFDYTEFVEMYSTNAYPFKKPELLEKNVTKRYDMSHNTEN